MPVPVHISLFSSGWREPGECQVFACRAHRMARGAAGGSSGSDVESISTGPALRVHSSEQNGERPFQRSGLWERTTIPQRPTRGEPLPLRQATATRKLTCPADKRHLDTDDTRLYRPGGSGSGPGSSLLTSARGSSRPSVLGSEVRGAAPEGLQGSTGPVKVALRLPKMYWPS